MIDCTNAEVRDALPDLLHGRLGELDTATMKAHVDSCPACRAELEIMREAASSAAMAPPIDAARVASAIMPYAGVTVAAPRKPAMGGLSMLRIAAAALIIGAAGWGLYSANDEGSSGSRETASATQPAATPAENSPAVSEPAASIASGSVATNNGAETQVASLSLVGSTADLSDSDLEKLVAELDGIETLPSAEPHSITIVDDLGGN